LASISHVARLTILTKTRHQAYGFKVRILPRVSLRQSKSHSPVSFRRIISTASQPESRDRPLPTKARRSSWRSSSTTCRPDERH
jgi:DNA mismatch repair ATPase MutL